MERIELLRRLITPALKRYLWGLEPDDILHELLLNGTPPKHALATAYRIIRRSRRDSLLAQVEEAYTPERRHLILEAIRMAPHVIPLWLAGYSSREISTITHQSRHAVQKTVRDVLRRLNE